MTSQTHPVVHSPSVDSDPTSYADHDDASLMVSIQKRDQVALEALLSRHRGLIKSVILRVVVDHSAADDVLQECLIEIWNQAEHYSASKGRPISWILTMAKRRAIDHVRRSMSYARACDRFDSELNSDFHSHDDAKGDCESADISHVLSEQLERLPPPQQQVIRLAFLMGMSQREVARATQTPLGTVKTRLELALKKLKESLRTRSIHSMQAA